MQTGVVIHFVFEVLRVQIDQIAKGFFAFENGFMETHNTIQALIYRFLEPCVHGNIVAIFGTAFLGPQVHGMFGPSEWSGADAPRIRS